MTGRFLFTTFGSLGDLHPYMAVGIALQERGHTVTIATSEIYRAKVESEGLRFHPVRPDVAYLLNSPEEMAKAFHPRTGSEYIIRKIFMPYLEQSYEDTMAVATEADVLVGHAICFATPIIAEQLGKRWVSVLLQPSMLLSIWDPPKLAGFGPIYDWISWFGPAGWKQIYRLVRVIGNRWSEPIRRLRARAGLPPLHNVLQESMFSPYGSQAWFSKILTKRQPDWPAAVEITGFPFYDKLAAGEKIDPALKAFLEAGTEPIVFTLGSSAVFSAEQFYEESLEAAERLGRRAILLTGPDPRNKPKRAIPESVFVAEYAAYSQLLPRAAATVHQGGVGTTAQALISGKPMLFVPFSHDQPDNAMRCVRLGVARVLERHRYRGDRAAQELENLLTDPNYLVKAKAAAAAMRAEPGTIAICEGLEQHLASARAKPAEIR